MFGCTDLKAAIALCWYTVWKVEPLPLRVPESLVLDAEVGEPGAAVVLDEDEWELLPQAASKRAAARSGDPTARIRCVRRRGIGGAPLRASAVRWIDRYPSERCFTVSSLARLA
jgi:hypothetical protein